MNIANKLRNLVLPGLLAAGWWGAVQCAQSCVLPPWVTITGSDTNASEVGPDPGSFTVTRLGGNPGVALTVYYTIGGTADNGTDYQTLQNYVNLPAWQSNANITVTPILDSNCGEGAETVVLTLTSNANYYWIGGPSNATVYIADMDSDCDDLPDAWELHYFGNLNQTASGDYDQDGFSNLQEYQGGSDPTDYYNAVLPCLSLATTNYAVSSSSNYLLLPLVVRVTDTNGVPLTNAPLTFAVTNGTARLATNGTLTTNLFLRADSGGNASPWLFLRTDGLVTNQITVTAFSGTNQVQMELAAWVNDPGGTLYSVQYGTNVPPLPYTPELTLCWQNYDNLVHPKGGGNTNVSNGYNYPSNTLWLEITGKTNTSPTSSTAWFTIHTPDATNRYDLFSTTNLSANVPGLNLTNWVWLLRTTSGQTNIIATNLWPNQGWFCLGTMLNSDGGDLPDAYEKLVTHTDPNNSADDRVVPLVSLYVVDSVAVEQQSTNTARLLITRLGGFMGLPLTVGCQLAGTASNGVDYYLSPVTTTATNVLVTFAPGQTSVEITLAAVNDSLAEGTEYATLTLTTNVSPCEVNPAHASATAWILEPYTRVYTLNPDFNLGVLAGLETLNDQLQFKTNLPAQFPFINVACSARGTVARINTTNGMVIGEYRTAPVGISFPDPSRTTVDQYGNVWVANRQDTYAINGTNYGSITRIGLVLGPRFAKTNGVYYPDPNGQYVNVTNASYNTCLDRDGDGYIRTSSGLADILSWSNIRSGIFGVDSDGGVSTAEDEAITEYTRVLCTGTRTIAVDKFNDIWVGGHWGNRTHLKVNGLTAAPVPNSAFDANAGGYGGVIDSLGNLWSSGSANVNPIWLKPPTNFPVPSTNWQTLYNASGYYGYGIAVDPLYPYIWQTYGSDVFRWHTNGTAVTNANGSVILYPHHYSSSQGITVDTNGHVWVAQSSGATTVGHLDTNGVWLGNVQLRLSGLRAEFYANTNLDGVPAFVRADGPIDFDWGTNSPATGVPATNYSVKWSGVLHTRTEGEHVLCVTVDAGAGFYLGGNFWLNNWDYWYFDPSVTQLRTTNYLSASTDYNIELWYRKGPGASHVRLSWIEPGSGNEVAIPRSQLMGPQVGSHPTGVSVDSFGKIWAANLGSSSAMRIDPNAGDIVVTNGVTNYVGAADMYVDLGDGSSNDPHQPPYNVAAAPYNYSDMTGFNNRVVNPGLKPLKGYWSVINDCGLPGEIWNRVSWNAFLTNGCSIEAYVRASDDRQALASETFAVVTNNAAFTGIKGQFIELRLAMKRDDANKQPVLYDLTLNGTSSGFAGSGLMEDYAAFETDDAYFYADVIGPEPMTYQWFVQYPWTNQWASLPSVTGPELVLTNVDQWDDGTLFTVLVSNGSSESLWLGPAELWVWPLAINIPSFGAASRYPATINVRGEPTNLSSAEVTLYNFTHYHPDDLDVLLVSASGRKIMLMSEAGGYTSVTNTTLVFHPESWGYDPAPYQNPIPSGTTVNYSPSNYGQPSQLPGAPTGPYNGTLDQLAGDDPNGIWKLYIYDHAHNNGGVVQNSWGLSFHY